MRKVFLTTLCATAIGFSSPSAAWSQSIAVLPAANATPVPHSSKAGFDAMAKVRKSKIRRSLPVEEMKKDDSWFKQMPDPCQVEG
jgi:hypothetical protein